MSASAADRSRSGSTGADPAPVPERVEAARCVGTPHGVERCAGRATHRDPAGPTETAWVGPGRPSAGRPRRSAGADPVCRPAGSEARTR